MGVKASMLCDEIKATEKRNGGVKMMGGDVGRRKTGQSGWQVRPRWRRRTDLILESLLIKSTRVCGILT